MFEVDDQSTTEVTPTVVDQLVGEGKKYKTVDELAKAYMNADEFMETLKSENRTLKEQVTKVATLEEVMERLNQQGKPASTPTEDPPQTQKPLSTEELQALVESTVTGMETSKTRTENLKRANKLLKEAFGDKAEEVFKEVAKSPELEGVYRQLAQVDPDEFIKRFTAVPKNTGAQPDNGGTAILHQAGGNRVQIEGTKEYYDNVRRTDKALYYSQDFQIKMDRAVRSNPDRYFGKTS